MSLWAIISAVLLLSIAWNDFRDRSIPLFLLLAEIGISFVYFYRQEIFGYFQMLGLNLLFNGVQIGIVALWMRIKRGKLSFYREAFGLGDVLMMLIAAFFFSPVYYVLFVMISAFVSLLFAGIVKLFFDREQVVLVPLAGIMAILLFAVQIIYLDELIFLSLELPFL
jgi:hypothetical protein